MKRLTIFLTALALAVASVAAAEWRDVDVADLTENAPTREDYPDASAVFLHVQEGAELMDDGSVVTTRNKLIRVLSLRGRERYSNQSFLYNTDVEELELLKGVTTTKMGRVVEVEGDAINDVTPAFLEDATIYSNVMSRVFSFPVAGSGSTMELQLRENREPAPDGSFSGIEYMGAEDPILAAEFSVSYPDGSPEPASVGFTGGLGQVTVEKTASPGEISYRVEGVPALVEEEHMPPVNQLYPRVFYSSYGGWDEPAAFFAGQFFPHVDTGGDVAARVAELTDGMTSEGDIVRAVFLDVATDVRNIHLALGLGGYEPNDASQVLSNKYADTRDKAVLLISMLRAAGVSAYPALVSGTTGATFVESVPTLKQFSRILVALPDGDGYGFLDPFMDDAAYGFVRWGRGNTALVVKDDGTGELVDVPGFDADENVARQHMVMVLEADGSASIRATGELSGYFDRKTRIDLKDATPSEEQKLFDAAANLVSPGATDESHSHSDLTDLSEPVSVLQNIQAEDFAVPQGDMMIVHLPVFPHNFAKTGVAPMLAERKYPFVFPCELTNKLEIKVNLPEGYEVVWAPEDMALSTDDASVAITCEVHEQQHSLTWTQSIVIHDREVTVEDYSAFKDMYDALSSPKSRLLLLSRA